MCPAQDSNHIFWVRKETSEGGISYGDLLGCPGLVSKGLHRKSQPQMFFFLTQSTWFESCGGNTRGMCSVHPHLPWEASGCVWGNQRNGFCGYFAKCLSAMHGQAKQSFKTIRTERKRSFYRFIPSHLGKQLSTWCWHLQAALDLL